MQRTAIDCTGDASEAALGAELRERFGGWSLAEMEARAGGKDDLYFVRIPDGPVKIGRANNIKRRMSGLQCGCPWRLELIGIVPGAGYRESEWHAAFMSVRMEGEWFEWGSAIAEMIDRALSGGDYDEALKALSLASIEKWRLAYVERLTA